MNTAIVQEIRRQLFAGGQMKVWSWGARGWTAMDEYTLRFRVSGHHHKGYVSIFLTSMDDYAVKLLNLKGEVKKEIKGVYCDNLTDVIDEAVERIPAYKN
jgi:hypothetical protein